jgi:hypothetical protein
MAEARVHHGQEIRADLPGIGVMAIARDRFIPRYEENGEVFFCNMGPIRLRAVTSPGDGGPLPNDVILDGLEVAKWGTYDLLNVRVQSNGDLRVIVDRESRVVPTVRAREIGLAATYERPGRVEVWT